MVHTDTKICTSCRCIFENPDEYIEDHGELFSVCPRCGSDWEYACRCEGCGELFLEIDLTAGFCPACRAEILGRFRTALGGFTQEELDLLNEIYDGERIA